MKTSWLMHPFCFCGVYSPKQSCTHLTSWALSTNSTFKTGHFHKSLLLNGHYCDIQTRPGSLGTFARLSRCLLVHPPHRTATTAWIQTTGTLFGTAGKDSLSEAPPSSTSPCFSARYGSITSRTNRAATWYTDQVCGATKPANHCTSADVNMYVYLTFLVFCSEQHL